MRTLAPWLALVLVLGLSSPAQATRCTDWRRLSADAQDSAIVQAIDGVLTSNREKKWTSVNLGRIRQCLIGSMDAIRIDFDSTCSEGQRASMAALEDLVHDYARSCAWNR